MNRREMKRGERLARLLSLRGLPSAFCGLSGNLTSTPWGQSDQAPLAADLAAFSAHLGHDARDQGVIDAGGFLVGGPNGLQHHRACVLNSVRLVGASSLLHGLSMT